MFIDNLIWLCVIGIIIYGIYTDSNDGHNKKHYY